MTMTLALDIFRALADGTRLRILGLLFPMALAWMAWRSSREHAMNAATGLLYLAITQFLGFPHYGDEFTVMGLAPYGTPKHVDALSRLVTLNAWGTEAPR